MYRGFVIHFRKLPLCSICNPYRSMNEIEYGCVIEHDDTLYCIQCAYDTGIMTDEEYESIIESEREACSLHRAMNAVVGIK